MVRILRSIPIEKIKLMVFDLDGTLVDSSKDLANSVGATLEQFGCDPLPYEDVTRMVGNGALMLVQRAFAASKGGALNEEKLNQAYAFFLSYYDEHKLDYTYAYEGVRESLAAIKAAQDSPGDIAMAVLTNKPVKPAVAICEGLGLTEYFFEIIGGNSLPTKKPDPEGMFYLMEKVGARPEETVMIGDSKVDVEVARNAGTWVVGCTFGLSPETLVANPPDVLVDFASDWTEILAPAKIKI